MATALATALGKTVRNSQTSWAGFVNWYNGLLRNKQAHAFVMSNLPQEARKKLSDFYRVSRGISQALQTRIQTGRLQVMKDILQRGDNLLSRIYATATRAAAGVAAEAITTPMGIPGAGVAAGIASALSKGTPSVMRAADDLIKSPEFSAAVRQLGQSGERVSVRRLAMSRAFSKFMKVVNGPTTLTSREQWILAAFQGSHQLGNLTEK